MKKYQVMTDIETFDQLPTAAIASIGAVIFDVNEGIIDRFYANVSITDCLSYGLTKSELTMEWWKSQPSEVLRALMHDAKPLKEALSTYTSFVRKYRCDVFWAHGASFDFPIMSYAYHKCGMKEPWKYWESRCSRTVMKLFDMEPERIEGKHHNAMEDAEQQAISLIKLFKELQ